MYEEEKDKLQERENFYRNFFNSHYEEVYHDKLEREREKVSEQKKTIKNLKIYNRVLKFIAFGATLVAVAVASGSYQKIHDLTIEVVEYDNDKFEQEKEEQNQEIYETTGRTTEEITNSGMNK